MLTTDCRRRPHSVWTTCPCEVCRVDAARMSKLARAGGYRRVSSDQAWDAIQRMLDAGWTHAAIASAAGLPARLIWGATQTRRQGRTYTFGPRASERLIAAEQAAPTRGYISGLGARRRLQALSAIGWTMYRLAKETGLPASTVAAIRGGVTERIRPAIDQTVREAYERLCMRVPPATRDTNHSRFHAQRKGWAPPLAFDDIDDPLEVPKFGNEHDVKAIRAERQAEVARLHALGLSYTQIAERIGKSMRQVHRDLSDMGLTRREAS